MSTGTAVIRPSASLIIAAPLPANNSANASSSSYDNKQKGKGAPGCNYRILMMKRNARSSFINAHVYPGGIIDEADDYKHWFDYFDNQSISTKQGQMLTSKICAIRETFEESGLLLSDPPITQVKAVKEASLHSWRHRVHEDARQFKVMCDTFSIRPAVNQLIPFSNWITPVIEKKRYNTLFFLTVLDHYHSEEEQRKHLNLVVSADGKETVLFDWFKPEEAIQQQKDSKIIMIPPQWYTLTVLSTIHNHQDLILKAGIDVFKTKSGELLKILPQSNATESDSPEAKKGFKFYLAYPGDEMYQSSDYAKQKGNRHRVYFKGRMEEYVLERNVKASDIVVQPSSL